MKKNTALSQTISTLPLPGICNIQEWDKPVDLPRLQKWMAGLIPFYNQSLPTEGLAAAAKQTAVALEAAGFTSAEVRFAFKQIWKDSGMMWVFAKNYPLNPAMFVPHIHQLRKLQVALLAPMHYGTVIRLCQEFPDELHTTDFGVCSHGYGSQSHVPMYIYLRVKRIKDAGRKSKRLKNVSNIATGQQLFGAWMMGGEE